MKLTSLRAGAVLHDGKRGLRHILSLPTTDDGDVQYKVLVSHQNRDNGEVSGCTLASLAQWAKTEVPAEKVAEVEANLLAQNTRLTPSQANLLRRLSADQGDNNHLLALTGPERRLQPKLVNEGLLIAPSGTNTMARLSLVGRAYVARLNQAEAGNQAELDQAVETPPAPRRPGPR